MELDASAGGSREAHGYLWREQRRDRTIRQIGSHSNRVRRRIVMEPQGGDQHPCAAVEGDVGCHVLMFPSSLVLLGKTVV